MKKVVAVCVVVVFATLLCQLGFSEEASPPARRRAAGEAARPRMTEEQRTEFREARQRVGELNELLQEATAKARQKESVIKAFEDVRAKQEALRTAQQKAYETLEAALGNEVEGNETLTKALAERKKLQEKFRQLVGRFPGMGFGAGRFGTTRRGAGGERPQRPEGARRPRGGGQSGGTAQ
jgi:hypothetical protein